MSSAEKHVFEEIPVGFRTQRNYVITPAVYEAFLAAYDDRSPIHVDEAYARTLGYKGRVMHGGILNGFLSHFVGMHFPGARALLVSTDLRFLKPSFLGDAIRLEAEVSQKVESARVLVLTLTFHNETQGIAVARGRIQVVTRDE